MGIGGSYQESSSKARDLTPKEFKDLRQPIADLYAGILPNVESFLGGGMQFQGPTGTDLDYYRAPMTQGERFALENLGNLTQPTESQILSEDLINRTLRGEYLEPETNPALMNMLAVTNRAINDAFNQQGLEQRALFSRAGQQLPESSPFAQAAVNLDAERLKAIGQNTAQLVFGVGEAERGRQLTALEQQRTQAGFEFNRQLEFLQANALPRLIDELGFDRAFAEYSARINALSQALGLATGTTPATPVIESESMGVSGNFEWPGLGGSSKPPG